jgi:hypothetical protein
MSKPISKAISVQFEEALRKALPRFCSVKGEPLPGGCRLYVWKAASDLSFYILLNIDRGERFSIDLAWTRNGRWPATFLASVPRDIPEKRRKRSDPEGGAFRFRLPYLWLDRDHEWELVPRIPTGAFTRMSAAEILELLDETHLDEELLPKVPPLVGDAIEKLETYALPYFIEVAQELGVAINGVGQ